MYHMYSFFVRSFVSGQLLASKISWRHQHVAAVLCWTEPPNSDRWGRVDATLKLKKKRTTMFTCKNMYHTCSVYNLSFSDASTSLVTCLWRVPLQSNYRRWHCSATPFVTTNWTTSTCSCCAMLNRTTKQRQVTEHATLKLEKKDDNI